MMHQQKETEALDAKTKRSLFLRNAVLLPIFRGPLFATLFAYLFHPLWLFLCRRLVFHHSDLLSSFPLFLFFFNTKDDLDDDKMLFTANVVCFMFAMLIPRALAYFVCDRLFSWEKEKKSNKKKKKNVYDSALLPIVVDPLQPSLSGEGKGNKEQDDDDDDDDDELKRQQKQQERKQEQQLISDSRFHVLLLHWIIHPLFILGCASYFFSRSVNDSSFRQKLLANTDPFAPLVKSPLRLVDDSTSSSSSLNNVINTLFTLYVWFFIKNLVFELLFYIFHRLAHFYSSAYTPFHSQHHSHRRKTHFSSAEFSSWLECLGFDFCLPVAIQFANGEANDTLWLFVVHTGMWRVFQAYELHTGFSVQLQLALLQVQSGNSKKKGANSEENNNLTFFSFFSFSSLIKFVNWIGLFHPLAALLHEWHHHTGGRHEAFGLACWSDYACGTAEHFLERLKCERIYLLKDDNNNNNEQILRWSIDWNSGEKKEENCRNSRLEKKKKNQRLKSRSRSTSSKKKKRTKSS